ncbi:MAG: hypothetical protein LBP58_08925 [Azoarcus sp.]|jgi:hypothetical protein|nr:hypothetical protein [Azoarcus sp.]
MNFVHFVQVILFLLVGAYQMTANATNSTGAETMKKDCASSPEDGVILHISSPEAEVFLEFAVISVRDFIREHHRCPRQWAELDFTYAYGPFHVTDPDVRPRPQDGTSWRPRKSNYIYLMETVDDGKSCRLVAVNNEGRRELYIQPDMDYPAPVK